MGFVDFTPKKKSILQDVVRQVELSVGPGVAHPYWVQNYTLSNGSYVPLYSISYGEAYKLAIEAIANRSHLVILNTPLTKCSIKIERKRPASFFLAQADSNAFNHSIRGAQVIDLPDFDELLTYDAVHFTNLGNELIYSHIWRHL